MFIPYGLNGKHLNFSLASVLCVLRCGNLHRCLVSGEQDQRGFGMEFDFPSPEGLLAEVLYHIDYFCPLSVWSSDGAFLSFLRDVQDFICYLFQCVVVYFQLKHMWILTCELLPLFLWKSFCLGCVPKGGEKPGFVSCERRFANDFNGRKNGPLNYIQWKAVFKNMHFCQWGRLLTALHLVGCCLHSTWNSHGFKFFLLNWDKLASQTRPCECVKKCYDQDCVFSCILLEEHAFPLIALSGIQNTTP